VKIVPMDAGQSNMAQQILVADDDVAALDGLRALLSAWGFEVQTATDGRQALERIAKTQPALVITDIVMPTMDGLELLTALKIHRPRLPVLVMTGQGDADMLASATAKGADGYLAKPLDLRRLKALMVALTSRHDDRGTAAAAG
jgi:DNA-binding NtrC family response regulator